jgi:hypothetical protein
MQQKRVGNDFVTKSAGKDDQRGGAEQGTHVCVWMQKMLGTWGQTRSSKRINGEQHQASR